MPKQVTIERTSLLDHLVEALESGEYEQGQNFLRYYNPETNKDHYCCLGVLCDLWPQSAGRWKRGVSEGVLSERGIDQDNVWSMSFGNDTFIDYPVPQAVRDAGITINEMTTLAGLNDEGYNFMQIADYIKSVIIGDEEELEWRGRMAGTMTEELSQPS